MSPLVGLGSPRARGQLRLCPGTALCPCPSYSLCPFSSGPCLSRCLCMSVRPCSLSSGWLSPLSSTWLCPSAAVSLSVVSFPPHLPASPRLIPDASAALSSAVPLPFASWSPVPWLAAPEGGGCSSPNGAARGHLGARTGVPFPVTSTRPSPQQGSVFPLQLRGVGGAALGGRHGAQHLLGSPEAPDPPAAVQGSGSRGSEVIMIASARPRRSRGRWKSERGSEGARQRRPRHLFMQSALRRGPRRPGARPGSGHRVRSPLLLVAPRRLGRPSPRTQRGCGRAEPRGAGRC